MKQHDEDARGDSLLFDRIVDGGMTPDELRAAVEQLEREPDGWKRCALAFLEAQALNESLRALGQAEKQGPDGPVLALHPAAAARGGHHLGWLRGVAAAVIVGISFGAGWMSHPAQVGSPRQDSLARGSAGTPLPQLSEGGPSGRASATSSAAEEERGLPPAEPSEAIRTVATIRFGPEGSPSEVPVLAGPGLTEDWLAHQPPPVSEHGQVVLARQGYQVEQRRQFYTAVLADGRRVAIPVDHVQIQYTGNEPL